MNTHVPQSDQTAIELRHLADVKQHIITPRESKPIVGMVQDSRLGSFLFTADENKLHWKDAMNLLVYTSSEDFHMFEKNKDYNGKFMFSRFIPGEVNMEGKNALGEKILIKESEYLSGKLDKKGINNILIYNIWDKYGPIVTKHFIDDTQRILEHWLLSEGFSVGLTDCIVNDKKVVEEATTIIESKVLEADCLLTEIENNHELMDPKAFEDALFGNLMAVHNNIAKRVADSLGMENSFFVMEKSGSKGSALNVGQIAAQIGQQVLMQARIPKKVNNRTLAHFYQNDDGARARGFIEHSYYRGMEPHEFFFHTMAGREGLIDTAIKTANSGYISRKLIKGLEDIYIAYDGTVRNAVGVVMQYVYGDSGVEQIYQTRQSLPLVKMSDPEIEKNFGFNSDEAKKVAKQHKIKPEDVAKMSKKLVQEMKELRDMMRDSYHRANLNYGDYTTGYDTNVNYKRIIYDAIHSKKTKYEEDISPIEIMQTLDNLMTPEESKLTCMSKAAMQDKKCIKYQDQLMAKKLFRAFLLQHLGPKVCLEKHKFTKRSFEYAIKEVYKSFNKSIVDAGEMVGVLGAQSLGEPSTQMTLNTFHSTGSLNVGMQGIPRLNELLNFTSNNKTPMMFIYLQEKYSQDDVMVNRIASYLMNTTMGDVINKIDVYYDPTPYDEESLIKKDNISKSIYFVKSNREVEANVSSLPWVYRMTVGRDKLIDKEVTLLDIKTQFVTYWRNHYSDSKSVKKSEKEIINRISNCGIMTSNENDKNPTVHIRVDFNKVDFNTLMEFQTIILESFKLKGINGVEKIDGINKVEKVVVNPKDKSVSTIKENVIFSGGVNMVDIRYIPGIDLNRTLTNHVVSVYEEFGVEAVRSILLYECGKVFSENHVNYHHISILIDAMTYTGAVTSMDRFGINRLDTDVLSRASFEMTVDQLLTAAVFNEVDQMRSVSSRIMVGKTFKGGTALCELELDVDLIKNSEAVEETVTLTEKVFNRISGNAFVDGALNQASYPIFTPA